MSTPSTFKMSQALVIRSQKSNDAFIIPCHEWDFLKDQLGSFSMDQVMLQTVGGALLGASVSVVASILFGGITTDRHPNALVVAWAVVAVTAFCGVVALRFGNKQQELQRIHAGTVLKQMQLIESRFDRS